MAVNLSAWLIAAVGLKVLSFLPTFKSNSTWWSIKNCKLPNGKRLLESFKSIMRDLCCYIGVDTKFWSWRFSHGYTKACGFYSLLWQTGEWKIINKKWPWLPSDFYRNIFNAPFSASCQISLRLLKCYLHYICIQSHFLMPQALKRTFKSSGLSWRYLKCFPEIECSSSATAQ